MSKIAVSGNASGTGTFTIASPATNTDRTLSLPDEAGTVLTSGTDVANFPSGFANGITEADQWRLTTTFSGSATPISSNLERVDSTGWGYIGTGMSESSGVFSFPSTGIWHITATFTFDEEASGGSDVEVIGEPAITINNGSNWSSIAYASTFLDSNSNATSTVSANFYVDVTDTANVKVRFGVANQLANNRTIGNSSVNQTYFTFIRLGDT